MENDNDKVTHVTREEARSGASTHVTRYVLSISLALVIVAFAIVLAKGFFGNDPLPTQNSQIASNASSNVSETVKP